MIDSLFDKELQNTISNIKNGIAELTEIRKKYEELIDTQSNAMQPIEVATEALNDMVDAFKELKKKHLDTLKNVQEKFSDAIKVMCTTLDERTKEMIDKVSEAQNSFELLKETRDDLVAKVTTISDVLGDANQKLVQPFENVVAKTVSLFEAESLKLHSKIECNQEVLLDQLDSRQQMLENTEKIFQDGIKVIEQGVVEMNKLNQMCTTFIKDAEKKFSNFSTRALEKMDRLNNIASGTATRSKILCGLTILVVLLLLFIVATIKGWLS